MKKIKIIKNGLIQSFFIKSNRFLLNKHADTLTILTDGNQKKYF